MSSYIYCNEMYVHTCAKLRNTLIMCLPYISVYAYVCV